MRPVIGLIPLYDDDRDSYWMLPGYMKAIEKCGGLPIMLPLTEDAEEIAAGYNLCDGILFTGGHDVSPVIYGDEVSDKCGKTCPVRDKMEAIILEKCLKDNKAFLGICRGIQFINACLGGTLYQDLPSEHASNVEHHMEPPYDRVIHNIEVLENTKLSDIIGAGTHGVNSYHHQAIKTPADGLKIMAVSEDGIIEAVEVSDQRFAIAIQWHPEFSYENNKESIKIMQAFVNSCFKVN
jgi:putative glutamine amidotransferase